VIEVGIVVGSKSDLPVMQKCADILTEMGIESETRVLSAHRAPAQMSEWARTARGRGVKVIIAAAGMAGPPARRGSRLVDPPSDRRAPGVR